MAGQRASRSPLYDFHPQTGASIEVFYADRSMETFGRCGAGWFWCSHWRGFAPGGPATGPFATSYAAYRNAVTTPELVAHLKAGGYQVNADIVRTRGFSGNTRTELSH